jgi:hypothetical protein
MVEHHLFLAGLDDAFCASAFERPASSSVRPTFTRVLCHKLEHQHLFRLSISVTSRNRLQVLVRVEIGVKDDDCASSARDVSANVISTHLYPPSPD